MLPNDTEKRKQAVKRAHITGYLNMYEKMAKKVAWMEQEERIQFLSDEFDAVRRDKLPQKKARIEALSDLFNRHHARFQHVFNQKSFVVEYRPHPKAEFYPY